MDFLNRNQNTTSTASQTQTQPTTNNAPNGGLMNRMNGAMGGGAAGERNEDLLDKGVDMFQERVMGAGPQTNESAFEQAKDERISDGIRSGYKSVTGKDVPIRDK